MHLVHESQPTGDIKINMSKEIENTVNCDINSDIIDIKREINNANKENDPNTDEETMSITQKSLNLENEKTKHNVYVEEKTQATIVNGSEFSDCNREEIDVLKESELDGINSIIMENLTNGTNDISNKHEPKCEDPSDIFIANKELAEELDMFNNDENPDCMAEKDSCSVETNEKFELSENESRMSDESIGDNKPEGVENKEISQTSCAEPNVKVQEESASEENRKLMKDTTNSEEVITEMKSVASVEEEPINVDNTSEATTPVTEDIKCDATRAEDTTSPVRYERNDTLKIDDINSAKTISTVTENSFEVPADTAKSNEESNLAETSLLLNKILPLNDSKHSDDISIDEENGISSEELAILAIADKTETLSEETTVENCSTAVNNTFDHVFPADIEMEVDDVLPADVEMEEEIVKTVEIPLQVTSDTSAEVIANHLPSTTDNNVKEIENLTMISAEMPLQVMSDTFADTASNNGFNTDNNNIKETEKLAPLSDTIVNTELYQASTDNNVKEIVPLQAINVDEEKLSSTVGESLKSVECVSIHKEKDLLQVNADQTHLEIDKTQDIAMADSTITLVADKITSPIKQVVDTVLKSSLNVAQESVVSDNKPCKDKELVNGDKQIDIIAMEVNDVEIIDLDKEKNETTNSITETILSNVVNDTSQLIESVPKSEVTTDKSANHLVLDEDIKNKTEKTVENENFTDLSIKNKTNDLEDQDNVEILDEDDVTIVENTAEKTTLTSQEKEKNPEEIETKTLPVVCKLSNTLDILSEDEEEPLKVETKEIDNKPAEKQCIDIDEDDDIMFIEDDSNSKEAISEDKTEVLRDTSDKEDTLPKPDSKLVIESSEKEITMDNTELSPKINEKDASPVNSMCTELDPLQQTEKIPEEKTEKTEQKKPLLAQNFLKTAKKGIAEMTRDELEDFCVLRIVEGIVDRSNLSDIKTKIKTMAQNLEDYRKRIMMLTKQNRDLQVVLKSVQEEQKKRTNTPIQPLKITRSVGMQVLMNDKLDSRRKALIPAPPSVAPVSRPPRAAQNAKNIKPLGTPATIPVPRKVPVNNSPAKALTSSPANNIGKIASPNPNGIRNPSPVQKAPEKRTHSRMQSTSSSVTVDLTDDEPPAKITNVPPVRVVPPQNLLTQQRPFAQPMNSPRKVYIPISGPQGQNIRPGQALTVKGGLVPGPRQRIPPILRMQQSPVRVQKQVSQRHPAPLPDAMKQYTPPTWKALPPAPDLKLSKVENGIVISWKIDGYPEGGYETIASYQLYAYQETTAPPCTALWKKIGDVKALPLPMACTLTQFMAGFKYYFAVRAVDIRSRLGPFSLPGSILLLNKV